MRVAFTGKNCPADWCSPVEADVIAKLKRKAPRIGDDCAVIPNGDEDLLFTTDMLLESVHFIRTQPAEFLGAKAVLRALSDIAAMGGEPRYCLLSVAFGDWADMRWIDRFYSGAVGALGKFKTELIGGDMARTRRFSCDVTIVGAVPTGEALLRSGARVGDGIYVSGPLGRAASEQYKFLPEPRIRLGLWLRGRASACMDLSDGLSSDLQRMCTASGVEAELDDVPIWAGATEKQALDGGEDYELLFTASERINKTGVKRIGTMVDGKAGLVTLRGKKLEARGWDHFR